MKTEELEQRIKDLERLVNYLIVYVDNLYVKVDQRYINVNSHNEIPDKPLKSAYENLKEEDKV